MTTEHEDPFEAVAYDRDIRTNEWLEQFLTPDYFSAEYRKIRDDNKWLTKEKREQLYEWADGYAGEEGIAPRQVAAGYQVLKDRIDRIIDLCVGFTNTDPTARAVIYIAEGLG